MVNKTMIVHDLEDKVC